MKNSPNSENYDKLFRNCGIEIKIQDTNFLKIKETLTRIGISSNGTIYQSCHILHKKGVYGILHFKELFILDGKHANFDSDDLHRRNYVVKLLYDWNLIDCDNLTKLVIPDGISKQIKVLSFKDKSSWKLVPKYTIGSR